MAGVGQTSSATFMDYAIPRADDVPFFTVELNELPESDNPLGVKGAGENATTGTPAALMNAVRDAIAAAGAGGVDMPATREQVWRALSRARGIRVADRVHRSMVTTGLRDSAFIRTVICGGSGSDVGRGSAGSAGSHEVPSSPARPGNNRVLRNTPDRHSGRRAGDKV